MIVVSDTTAITNLIQVKLLLLFKNLFDQVIIPQAVFDELSSYSNQKDIIQKQNWIVVKEVMDQKLYNEVSSTLDKGEAEAITLAVETNADSLVTDELGGRKIAKAYGIRIIGLLALVSD